jgi:hypothetical protein
MLLVYVFRAHASHWKDADMARVCYALHARRVDGGNVGRAFRRRWWEIKKSNFLNQNPSPKRKASDWSIGSLCESIQLVAGVRFELTTFGL